MKPHRAAPLAAFVLHRYDWSESSLIVELFTREQGRVVAAAKGAKRPTSQLRPVLLPFQALAVTLGKLPEGASDVQTLKSAEWAGGLPALAGAALFRGFYVNELLLKLLARHDPHVRLFDAYAALLPVWGDADEMVAQAALRAFELALLRDIGLLPDLARTTASLAPVRADGHYLLRAETGVVATGGSPGAGGATASSNGLSGERLLAVQAALDEHDGGDTRQTMRALSVACAGGGAALRTSLRQLLLHHLGTPQLRTRQVLQDVNQLLPTAPQNPSSTSRA